MTENQKKDKKAPEYADLPENSDQILACEPSEAYRSEDARQGSYTIEDYYALPEERRVELIDGWIYDMASPSWAHQIILGQLYLQIAPCVENHPECLLLFAPSDVRLDNDQWTMVQPDLFITCNNKDNDHRRTNGAPDFIIEILSPSNRYHDTFRKLNKYRNARVREYWIVDPEKLTITVYDLEHDQQPVTYAFTDTVPIGISKGECSVDFARIYEKVSRHL
ncbi:MAG: Uma2 family endonuclease [Lachnospiraceae bacterium]|nr:Uma2 family endonuclease [Lachnospiraceae bacterium]